MNTSNLAIAAGCAIAIMYMADTMLRCGGSTLQRRIEMAASTLIGAVGLLLGAFTIAKGISHVL